MTKKAEYQSNSIDHTVDVYVVVLNWNGWQDTIECVESLLNLESKVYRIVIVDNGSTDGSLEKIALWASGRAVSLGNPAKLMQRSAPIEVVAYDRDKAEGGGDDQEEKRLASLSSEQSIVTISNGENIGFAAGANVGIRYAMCRKGRLIWLVNNDVIVMPDSLDRMTSALSETSSAAAATSQIRYYDRRDRIWNCGGNVTWFGTRRYDHGNQDINTVPQVGVKFISFATGCSLLIKAPVLKEYGLLSERFFFGEEDFEFALRMKRARKTMICVYDAIIYHKVGRSIDTSDTKTLVGKVYINYLNRFINIRHYWPKPVWWLWRLGYCIYIVPMLKLRYRLGMSSIFQTVTALVADSSALDRVSRSTFSDALGRDFR